jgi:hypothetical protein
MEFWLVSCVVAFAMLANITNAPAPSKESETTTKKLRCTMFVQIMQQITVGWGNKYRCKVWSVANGTLPPFKADEKEAFILGWEVGTTFLPTPPAVNEVFEVSFVHEGMLHEKTYLTPLTGFADNMDRVWLVENIIKVLPTHYAFQQGYLDLARLEWVEDLPTPQQNFKNMSGFSSVFRTLPLLKESPQDSRSLQFYPTTLHLKEYIYSLQQAGNATDKVHLLREGMVKNAPNQHIEVGKKYAQQFIIGTNNKIILWEKTDETHYQVSAFQEDLKILWRTILEMPTEIEASCNYLTHTDHELFYSLVKEGYLYQYEIYKINLEDGKKTALEVQTTHEIYNILPNQHHEIVGIVGLGEDRKSFSVVVGKKDYQLNLPPSLQHTYTNIDFKLHRKLSQCSIESSFKQLQSCFHSVGVATPTLWKHIYYAI